jgi:drug/metabolite transporter (DMT)-like permease
MKTQNKAVLLALLAVFFWSTVAVPFKIGLQYFSYIHFLFSTILIALLISAIYVSIGKKWNVLHTLKAKDWLLSLLAGFLNPFLYYLMLFKAYSLLPAQIAQSLNYTWPIMLVLLSAPILGQKIKKKTLSTLFIGFVGVYLIASQGQPMNFKPSNTFGVNLAISTSVVWALYWLINTKIKTDAAINLFLNFAFGALFTLPLVLISPDGFPHDIKGWIAVSYAGVFEMGITFIVWLTAMRLTQRTDQISHFVFLSPFLSLVFIFLILKEKIYLTTFLGLILIIGSILVEKKVWKKHN